MSDETLYMQSSTQYQDFVRPNIRLKRKEGAGKDDLLTLYEKLE